MQINPVVLIPVTDNVNAAYAVGHRLASKLEGQYRKQAFEYEGLTVIVDVKGSKAFIIITGPTGSFVSRPRLFAVNDGYENGVATGTGSLDYPLVDGNEKTSQTLSIDDGIVSVSFDNFLYGNIDWVGKNTAGEGEPSDASVLTWKGPTGRLIPFNPEVYISGFSTPDIIFSPEDTPKYTCFSKYIYQNGSVAYEFPVTTDEGAADIEPKVLGAALTGTSETLVCIVVNHYSGKIGFFEEVWMNNGEWIKLNSRQVGRPTAIWAFNQSGNKATQQNFEYEIDIVTQTATLITHDAGRGSYTTSGAGSSVSITHTGSYKSYSDYKGDERVVAVINVSDINTTTLTATNDETKTEATVYYQGVKPASDAYVTGTSELASVGASFSIAGSVDVCCDTSGVVWTLTDGTMSSSGTVLTSTGCGMGTVTATMPNCETQPTAMQVRLPNGSWTTISDTTYGTVYPFGGTWVAYTVDSGDTRTISYVFSTPILGSEGCDQETTCSYSDGFGCISSLQYLSSKTCSCPASSDYGLYYDWTGTYIENSYSYTKCEDTTVPCDPASPKGDLFTATLQNPGCYFMGRRVVQTYVC